MMVLPKVSRWRLGGITISVLLTANQKSNCDGLLLIEEDAL